MSARAWTSFAAVATLWGMPYLFIKLAVDDGVPPAFLAWSRVTLGAVVLLALAWRAGLLGTLRGRGKVLLAYTVAEIVIPFPLIAGGEQHVASSLAAILIAAVPLFIALLALRFDPAERAEGRRLVGLFVGLAGVIALVGIDVSGDPKELLGAAMILVAAFGYAVGPMVLKRTLADLDPRATMGASLLLASIALAPAAAIAPALDDAVRRRRSSRSSVLGLFCTAAAFVFFGVLIAEAGPGRAAVITYVAPVIAVALGVAVLGERPGAGAVAGLLLILAGSWLSTDGPPAAGAGGAGRAPARAPCGARAGTRFVGSRQRLIKRRAGRATGPDRPRGRARGTASGGPEGRRASRRATGRRRRTGARGPRSPRPCRRRRAATTPARPPARSTAWWWKEFTSSRGAADGAAEPRECSAIAIVVGRHRGQLGLAVAATCWCSVPPRATLSVWAPRHTPRSGRPAVVGQRASASSKASSAGSVGPSSAWRSRAP